MTVYTQKLVSVLFIPTNNSHDQNRKISIMVTTTLKHSQGYFKKPLNNKWLLEENTNDFFPFWRDIKPNGLSTGNIRTEETIGTQHKDTRS